MSSTNAPQKSPAVDSTTGAERISLWELHAREKAGLPDEWQIYKWEVFPKTGDKFLYAEITGAVGLVKYARGPRKGRTNWTKCSLQRTVVLPRADHEIWCATWEEKTGKCQECVGTGQVWAGWNHKTGNRYRPCRKCNATGKAPSVRDGNEEQSAARGKQNPVSSQPNAAGVPEQTLEET